MSGYVSACLNQCREAASWAVSQVHKAAERCDMEKVALAVGSVCTGLYFIDESGVPSAVYNRLVTQEEEGEKKEVRWGMFAVGCVMTAGGALVTAQAFENFVAEPEPEPKPYKEPLMIII